MSANDSIPWPKHGEILFKADEPDWENNACINYDSNAWVAYAEGFQRGSDALVERVIERSRDQDFLVYPIVFGYRQATELRLKALLRELPVLQNETIPRFMGHNLANLWRETKSRLVKVFPDDVKSDIDAVEDAILQLHKADPSSTGFRYPVDRDGNPTLIHLGVLINLRHLRDRMAGVLLFLDAAHSAIQALLDDKKAWEQHH